MTSKRVGALLAAAITLSLGASARADTPALISGNLALVPGMVLHIFRPVNSERKEIATLEVVAVGSEGAHLQLLRGTSALRSGDQIEPESPHAPSQVGREVANKP